MTTSSAAANLSPAQEPHVSAAPAARRKRWLRAVAWLTALLLAAAASVVALSTRAAAFELEPYRPSDELEKALAQIVGHPVRVTGAGRTDTGVHALGQVISFTIEWPDKHGLVALQRAMNANLSPDVVVLRLAEARPGFHPRFDARRRTYEYYILNAPVRRPLWRQRGTHHG